MGKSTDCRPKSLGEVELAVLNLVWEKGQCTAEACREALTPFHPMRESTVRTILRRLETKGYVAHAVNGRTFIYRAVEERRNVAIRAVKHIIQRFCDGSAEELVLGMVQNNVLDHRQIQRLAQRIAHKPILRDEHES